MNKQWMYGNGETVAIMLYHTHTKLKEPFWLQRRSSIINQAHVGEPFYAYVTSLAPAGAIIAPLKVPSHYTCKTKWVFEGDIQSYGLFGFLKSSLSFVCVCTGPQHRDHTCQVLNFLSQPIQDFLRKPGIKGNFRHTFAYNCGRNFKIPGTIWPTIKIYVQIAPSITPIIYMGIVGTRVTLAGFANL